MNENNVSSYEERILAAAVRLAQSADDPNASSEALSEIVLCARGMLRRQPPDAEAEEALQHRRRMITMVDCAAGEESRIEYDDPKEGER